MLSRQSKVPLYYQLYELLRAEILSDRWEPGDMLPTESDLLETYSVSRSTVRQALDALVNDGLIYRQRGRGTFVAEPAIEQQLGRIISFTDDMRARGMEPQTRVLEAAIEPAPEVIAEALNVDPGEPLVRLERLRLADGKPMSIERSYLVHRYCPGVLEGDYSRTPLREALITRFGIRLVRATQTIRAVGAAPEIAEQLGVEPDDPLLYIERISTSDLGIAIEYLRIYHRGDRYALYSELSDEPL
jgi:GntR family transcriptional regulator